MRDTPRPRSSRGVVALASTSPRRRALLEEAGIAFAAVDPGLSDAREDELARGWRATGCGPAEIAQRLAIAKALAAERLVPAGTSQVLAADTSVVLGDEVLGKPRDEAHARAMIERLAGRTHEVLTGVALLDLGTGKLTASVERSSVRFHALDAAALDRFLASGAWAGKAGAYGVQDEAARPLVAGVEGSRSNVIGLPLEKVRDLLGAAPRAMVSLAVLFLSLILTGCPDPKSSGNGSNPVVSPTPSPPLAQNNQAKGDGSPVDSGTPVVKKPFVPDKSEGLPQSGLPERILTIGGRKITVEIASTRAERQLGLMHRDAMGEDHGMLFVYPGTSKDFHSFWMQNTRIDLTAAFVRDDGTIVNLEDMERMTEESHPSHEPVRLVLEMNKGWFKIHGIQSGALIQGAAEALPLGE